MTRGAWNATAGTVRIGKWYFTNGATMSLVGLVGPRRWLNVLPYSDGPLPRRVK